MRNCIDCNVKLKNRSRRTVRCRGCHLKYMTLHPKGRKTGSCVSCGKKLSTKINKTSKCVNCSNRIPWNKGKQGIQPPWNKGISRFINKEHARLSRNENRRIKRKEMTAFEFISDRIRTLIRNSLKRVSLKKNTKTATLLGCSTDEFKKHLESQFTDGMSWNNYGNRNDQWNIDHIVQLCEFDLTDLGQQLIAFNYKNCRPLWARLNKTRPRINKGITIK